jgi:hypothetical protein
MVLIMKDHVVGVIDAVDLFPEPDDGDQGRRDFETLRNGAAPAAEIGEARGGQELAAGQRVFRIGGQTGVEGGQDFPGSLKGDGGGRRAGIFLAGREAVFDDFLEDRGRGDAFLPSQVGEETG